VIVKVAAPLPPLRDRPFSHGSRRSYSLSEQLDLLITKQGLLSPFAGEQPLFLDHVFQVRSARDCWLMVFNLSSIASETIDCTNDSGTLWGCTSMSVSASYCLV